MHRYPLAVLCAVAFCSPPFALANEIQPPLRWSFDSVPDDSLIGDAHLEPVGPSADHFAEMPDQNVSLLLDGKGDYFRIADDPSGRLDFDLGESITIEAWVRLNKIKPGQNVYLVGKGRTRLGGDKDNQNYALRLSGVGKSSSVSFLFRSVADKDHPSDFHRWTSKVGFLPDNQWHHVAVSYTFGEPTSIRGYVDGKAVSGSWDMGGPTDRGPIVDDDELWIGSSMGGSASSSLDGAIDEVTIHRSLVSKEALTSRRVVIERPPAIAAESIRPHAVAVTLHENFGSHSQWPVRLDDPTVTYHQTAFGFSEIPLPYGPGGVRRDWNGAVMLTAAASIDIPEGKMQWMVRAGGLSRLWIDDEVVIRTPPHLAATDGHGEVIPYQQEDPWLRPPRAGHTEQIVDHLHDSAEPVRVILQTMIGGEDLRPDAGEILVAYRAHEADPWQVLSLAESIPLTDRGWCIYEQQLQSVITVVNDQQRRLAASTEDKYWSQRHQRAADFVRSLPTNGQNSIDDFLDAKMADANVLASPLVDDDAFLRRLFLDCTGVIPTVAEIESFKATSGGRKAWIDQVLNDPRWADHWTVYWMDVLAENPNILKASLNNTGPFRWFLYDMMRDNVAVDRWVTNLIRMEGSAKYGGPAGFGIATQNDVPMAAKAHILSSAFLSNNMKCARCHDAPYHDWTQQHLFSIAAMLAGKPIKVPETSSVPDHFFSGDDENASLIKVTLKPGEEVSGSWPFEHGIAEDEWQSQSLGRPDGPRERLAFHLTRPENRRFAETIVNRLWRQLLGEAIVEPVADWEGARPSHPELLSYLARELTCSGYDFKHVARLILNSQAYQRLAVDRPVIRDEEQRYFEAPRRRRMTAEQVVDSLHVAVGRSMDSDELTFDPEARMKPAALTSLGRPQRAWQFASLSNERDRPALSLPRASAVCECLETLGWTGTRQEPINERADQANVLQPAILASGLLSVQLTRLTDEDDLTTACVEASAPEHLVDHLFMSFLGRLPTHVERNEFASLLKRGFASRVLDSPSSPETPTREAFVSWANHLNPEATQIRLREMERLRNGPPASGRLTTPWRERAEDAVWALINTPEFQFVP